MKHLTRIVLVAVLLVLGLTITQPTDHTQAAGYFFRWVSTTPGVCIAGYANTGVIVTYSLPASGTTAKYDASVNGGPTTTDGPNPFLFSGSNTTTTGLGRSGFSPTPPPPYTLVVRQTTYVNGNPIGMTIITIHCLANGTTTTTFQNTKAVGSQPAFTD